MVNYESEVRKEAVDFIEEVMDDVKEALNNEEGYLLDGDVDDRFFECVTDRSYTLSDAAFVIDNSDNIEDDSGLWQGQDPQEAIKTQAAFTFSNDVRSDVEYIYEQIKSEYDDKYEEIYDKMMENAPEKVDIDEDDFDPTDDARDAAFKFAEDYFYDEYDPKVEVVTDNFAKINMLEKYISLGRNADLWSGYPVGSSYIDSRCGIGYGMPNIHDYVEYDHMIARAIPDICGKNEGEVKEYLEVLEKGEMIMKKIIIIGIIVVCILLAGCLGGSKSAAPIDIRYYYSPTCSACAKMDIVMSNLTTYHNGEFVLTKYDVNVEKVKYYNDQITYHGDGSIPFVIIGNVSFNGYDPLDTDYFKFEYIINHRENFANGVNKTG